MSRFIGVATDSTNGERFLGIYPNEVKETETNETETKIELGGYSGEVPPLPIPNREVKLTCADGTAVLPWESR